MSSVANSEHKQNILVVDDEPQITRVLKTTLSSQGYGVRTAADGEEALYEMKTWSPDLLITDLRMPGVDGLELCRRVRVDSRMPIIILSVKGEEAIKVEALDAGADDYITKPFSVNELLARVRAAFRRSAVPDQEQSAVIVLGDFYIDVNDHRVEVGKQEVRLTPKEFDMLLYFARHPGKVITHRALLAAIWGPNSVEQPEYLRVFVGHLRKKLEVGDRSPKYIITEPWVGYRFEPGD
ncbi:MAG TPA: response regulator transcription factor [Terriglobales bacterium]|jgi:two-component system, OmpR family, KDP operon response regulator KdpE|nr:response regulator transcription factor [Terriglobales bacterium]